ncbi:hypothetical protein ACFE04_016721 [Oxalis oulophora]
MESFLMQDFSSDGNLLLDSIDFDDLFVGIDDSDMLPDLDSEIFGEFSSGSGEESSSVVTVEDLKTDDQDVNNNNFKKEEDDTNSSKREEECVVPVVLNTRPAPVQSKNSEKGRNKSSSAQQKSSSNNNNQGKRKLKVDWTPELHRRFVQAVEQLGVDKAVPSRILELMAIDCLTRHNIASHLQKYRSHRKHLQAREAEAAKWTHKRQMYSSAAVAAGGGVVKREIISPNWVAPATMGFPPMHHHQHPQHHFRPLHVWGHPSPPTSPPAAWAPPHPPPPSDLSYWHPHLRVPNGLTPGTPCFPQPMRFAAQPQPPQLPHAMYKVDPGIGQFAPYTPLDVRPSKESIDAAIGDALAKPWQPLPLGLKPPVLDTVLVELQHQGISKIPPT